MKNLYLILFLFCSYFGNSQQLIFNSDTLFVEQLGVRAIFPDTNICTVSLDYNLSWKIEDEKLYLIGIDDLWVSNCNGDLSSVRQVYFLNEFKDQLVNGKLFANDFSDTLIINYGRALPFPRMGNYESDFKNYFEFTLQIVVDSGKINGMSHYHNIDTTNNAISIFDSNTFDTIISVLNSSVRWDNLPFSDSENERDWLEDIFVLKLYANGSAEIKAYDEEGIKKGDYSCGKCKETLARQNEINSILSSIKFLRIKKYNKPIDCEIIFDIRYDLINKKVINPYLEK